MTPFFRKNQGVRKQFIIMARNPTIICRADKSCKRVLCAIRVLETIFISLLVTVINLLEESFISVNIDAVRVSGAREIFVVVKL